MLIQYDGKNIKQLELREFKLEKELQTFFEKNMFALTGYRFLTTEFPIEKYRMDSVAFNEEANAFVIVEYKRGKNESLVDQGYAYLKTLLSRKADFVLLYNEVMNEHRLAKDFDWSQTRIAFVSPCFTKNQKDATSFNGMAFELYEVKRYESGIYSVELLNQDKVALSDFNNRVELESTQSQVMRDVNKELKSYDLEYHFKTFQCNDFVQNSYEEMKEHILEMDDSLTENFTKMYISFKNENKKNVVAFWLKKDWIEVILNAKLGTLKDPYGIVYDISNRKWSSEQYAVKIKPGVDLDEVMELIRQCYKMNKN